MFDNTGIHTMKKITKLFYLSTAFIILTSCSTQYQRTGEFGGFNQSGYNDTRTNANTVTVSFMGNGLTPINKVKTYLLYRCAEVTINNGYDYFIVTSTSLSPINTVVHERTTQYSMNPPSPYYNRYRSTTYQSSSRQITATQSNIPVDSSQQHGAVAVIKMFQGRAPAGIPNAYNANDVIAHFGPELN